MKMKGFHIACLTNGRRSLSLSGGYIEVEIDVSQLITHAKKNNITVALES